ncbi:hypothetical protein M422DRAFT_243193 [Sphaerobolus stellatus SS14]|nr:hypothetical protein M422DRAFT_243193 [Sphaerobolus stellatus SS14]
MEDSSDIFMAQDAPVRIPFMEMRAISVVNEDLPIGLAVNSTINNHPITSLEIIIPDVEISPSSSSGVQLSRSHPPAPKDTIIVNAIAKISELSKDNKIDLLFRSRLTAMLAFLRLYQAE